MYYSGTLLMATPDKWPPLYNGHSPWSSLHWNNTYKTPDLWPPLEIFGPNGDLWPPLEIFGPIVAIIEGSTVM